MARDFGSGAPLPERRQSTRYPVVRPRPGVPLRFRVLAECWVGYWTHTLLDEDNRFTGSALCVGKPGCPYPHETVPLAWQGFVSAYDLEHSRRIVAALTRECARSLCRLLPPSAPLCGSQWTLERGQAPNSLIKVLYDGQAKPYAPRLEPHSCEHALQALWHLSDLPSVLVGLNQKRGEE